MDETNNLLLTNEQLDAAAATAITEATIDHVIPEMIHNHQHHEPTVAVTIPVMQEVEAQPPQPHDDLQHHVHHALDADLGGVIDNQQHGIIDSQHGVIDNQHGVIDNQHGIIDNQHGIIDNQQHSVIDHQQHFVDNQQHLVMVANPLPDGTQGIQGASALGVPSPFMTTNDISVAAPAQPQQVIQLQEVVQVHGGPVHQYDNSNVIQNLVAVKTEPLSTTKPNKQKRVSTGTAGSQTKRRKYNTSAKKTLPRWNDMCYQLLLFRADHNHCMVPFKSGGELGKWVATQRAQYASLQKRNNRQPSTPGGNDDGIKNEYDIENADPNNPDFLAMDPAISLDHAESLNDERVKVLTSLGFVWDVVQADNDARWRKRFEELVEYKNIHGHCNVPQSTDLGKWVKMQRENKHETDLKREGKTPLRKKPKPCLSDERIMKLESIGFQWRVAKPAVGWDRRFQQLCEYKEKHGDCNVPQSYPPDKPFGRWVMKQRCQQSLKLRGEKSQLTDEREKKLTDLGFSWVAPGFSKKTVTMPMSMADDALSDDEDDENGGNGTHLNSDPTQTSVENPIQQQQIVNTPVEIQETVTVPATMYTQAPQEEHQQMVLVNTMEPQMTYTVDPTAVSQQQTNQESEAMAPAWNV